MGSPLPLRALLSHADEYGAAVRNAMPKKVIVAYHGSPHSFDAFDASKIGTGEGAQTYGHGLYFAGNERVADQYRRRLAGDPLPMDLAIDGRPVFRESWQSLTPLHKDGANYLLSRLRNYSDAHAHKAIGEIGRDLPGLLEDAAAGAGSMERFAAERRLSELRGALDLLQTRRVSVLPPERPGHTYEVEIDYPEEALLDWDAPMSRQPQRVLDALARGGLTARTLPPERWLGRDAYHAAVQAAGSDTGAAAIVRGEGIPGIRYLDQGSRSAGEGTRNFVMFPGTEDRIRILRKYGVLAPVAAAAGTNSEE